MIAVIGFAIGGLTVAADRRVRRLAPALLLGLWVLLAGCNDIGGVVGLPEPTRSLPLTRVDLLNDTDDAVFAVVRGDQLQPEQLYHGIVQPHTEVPIVAQFGSADIDLTIYRADSCWMLDIQDFSAGSVLITWYDGFSTSVKPNVDFDGRTTDQTFAVSPGDPCDP